MMEINARLEKEGKVLFEGNGKKVLKEIDDLLK